MRGRPSRGWRPPPRSNPVAGRGGADRARPAPGAHVGAQDLRTVGARPARWRSRQCRGRVRLQDRVGCRSPPLPGIHTGSPSSRQCPSRQGRRSALLHSAPGRSSAEAGRLSGHHARSLPGGAPHRTSSGARSLAHSSAASIAALHAASESVSPLPLQTCRTCPRGRIRAGDGEVTPVEGPHAHHTGDADALQQRAGRTAPGGFESGHARTGSIHWIPDRARRIPRKPGRPEAREVAPVLVQRRTDRVSRVQR